MHRAAPRPVRLSLLQPVLTFTARKNARTRELAAAMRMPCTACRRSLASHIGAGNRWKGCQDVTGARPMSGFAIFRSAMTDNARRPHIFTITDSPRLPRELWERFRATAQERGDQTIDALRQALELYVEQKPEPRA